MKKIERWVRYPDSDNKLTCPDCDSDIEVLTSLSDGEINTGLYEDGAVVRCDSGCLDASIVVNDEKAEIIFFEEEEE